MSRILLTLSLIFFVSSCLTHKGVWLDGRCRPKKPNFKLNNAIFNECGEIIFNKVYIISEYPNSFGYGFYSDGRLVYFHSSDGFELKSEDVFGFSFENAPAIGYWRFNDDKLEAEYFSCSNNGSYIRKHCILRGDTIIIEINCGTSNPLRTKKCPERYILSDIGFE